VALALALALIVKVLALALALNTLVFCLHVIHCYLWHVLELCKCPVHHTENCPYTYTGKHHSNKCLANANKGAYNSRQRMKAQAEEPPTRHRLSFCGAGT